MKIKLVMRHHFDLLVCIGLTDFIISNQAIFLWDILGRNGK